MKKSVILLGIALLAAGTIDAQTAAATTKTAALAPTTSIDLGVFGIPATLQAPPNTKAVPGEWSNTITDDNKFNISLEETSMTLSDRKNELTANGENKITKSSETAFIYVEKMMGRELAHFECIVTIDGVNYRFYDKRVTPLDEQAVLPMYNAVLTLKLK